MIVSNFPCTGCGACCKKISGIPELEFFCDGNGRCLNLDAYNKCSIYHERPLICRVDEMYVNFYRHVSIDEFYCLNAIVCNGLQESLGIDESYRVLIGV